MLSYRDTSVVATAELVNAAPAVVTDIHVANINTADCWLHIYNASATGDVTVGSTTPLRSYHVPLGDGTDYGVFAMSFASPIRCTTGIVVAATTTLTGSTAPGTGLVLNLGYG